MKVPTKNNRLPDLLKEVKDFSNDETLTKTGRALFQAQEVVSFFNKTYDSDKIPDEVYEVIDKLECCLWDVNLDD